MSNTPTTNFGYNKPAIGDRGWGTTQNGNWDTLDTDFSVEHRSDSGNHGKHGPKVTIVQSGADNALVITKSNTGVGNVVGITNSGTGYGVNISQPGESTALNIVTSATGNQPILVFAPRLGPYFEVTGTGGYGLSVVRSATGSGIGISVTNSGTGEGIHLDQDGAGIGLRIDQVGNSNAVQVTKSSTDASTAVVVNVSTGSGVALAVYNTGGTGGSILVDHTNAVSGANAIMVNCSQSDGWAGIRVNASNGAYGMYISQASNQIGFDIYTNATGGTNLFQIRNQNTASTRQASSIYNSGKGTSLYILHDNGDSGAHAINVTCSQSGGWAGLNIAAANGAEGIFVGQGGNRSGVEVYTGATGSAHLVYVRQEATAGTRNAIYVNNLGTGAGVYIDQSGNGIAVDLNQTTTSNTSHVLDILNSGTGRSVNISQVGAASAIAIVQGGNANSISVTNNGTGQALTIAQNATGNWGIYVAPANYGMRIERTTTGGNELVNIVNSNTGSAGVPFSVWNSGSGQAVAISNSGVSVGLGVTQYGAADGIYLTQAAAWTGLEIYKSNTGGGQGMLITNQGTGVGAAINQNGDAIALQIDQNAASNVGIDVTAKYCQRLVMDVDAGYGLHIAQSVNTIEPNSGYGLFVINKSGTGSSPAMIVNNSGTGNSLIINQYAAAIPLYIKSYSSGATITLDSSTANSNVQATFKRTDGASDPDMYLTYWGTNDYNTLALTNGNGQGVHVNTSGNVIVSDFGGSRFNGSGRFVVMDGNVGIGNISPSARLQVDQTAEAIGLLINTSATNNQGLKVLGKYGMATIVNASGGYGLVVQTTNSTHEPSQMIWAYKTGTGSSPAVQVDNSGTGESILIGQAGNGFGIRINNSGSSSGLRINQSFTTTASAAIDVESSADGVGIAVNQTLASNNGAGLQIVTSSTNAYAADMFAKKYGQVIRLTGGGGYGLLVYTTASTIEPGVSTGMVWLDKRGTGASPVILMSNSGTGAGLFVDQIGNGIAIDLNQTITTATANVIDINNSGTGASIWASQNGAGYATYIEQNAGNVGLYMRKVHTGGDRAVWVANSGSGASLYINHANTGNFTVIDIVNSGTGDSILDDSGAKLTAAGSWTSVSSRITKQNLEELSTITFKDINQDIVDVGDKIDAVKVYRFESKRVPGYKHIGIMAEDFYEAFGVGEDNKTISATDVAAVLWHEVQQLRARVKALEGK